MLKTMIAVVLPISVCTFITHAEVITGNGYPQEYISFQEFTPDLLYVPGLDASIGGVYNFVGSGFTNYNLVASTGQTGRSFLFLESSNNSGILTRSYFTEGQSLLSNLGLNPPSPELPLALENSGFYDYAGLDGETLYLGFVIEIDTGSGIDRNYGFFQVLHEAGLDYRVIGWAYETEIDRDITTFNIPAPSGLALLGLGGLAVSRRRR